MSASSVILIFPELLSDVASFRRKPVRDNSRMTGQFPLVENSRLDKKELMNYRISIIVKE